MNTIAATERKVSVPDGHLVADIAGTGPPVVLLHAGGMQRVMWDHAFAWIAQHYTAIRYDARGNGDASTPIADYSPSEDLIAVLDDLGIDRAVLIGISLGARCGLETALNFPERVAGLALGGPGVAGMTNDDPRLADVRSARDEALADLDAERWIENFIIEGLDGPVRGLEAVDPELRQWCRDVVMDTVQRHAHGTGQPQDVNVLGNLGSINVPAVLINGRWDTSDIHRVVNQLETGLPDVERVDLDTGHLINLEDPAGFRRAVESVLNRVEGW